MPWVAQNKECAMHEFRAFQRKMPRLSMSSATPTLLVWQWLSTSLVRQKALHADASDRLADCGYLTDPRRPRTAKLPQLQSLDLA